MRRKQKFSKVICVLLVCIMMITVGCNEAMAATKSSSWVSRDGKTLYRAIVTTKEVGSKKKPLTLWMNKKKGVSCTLAVTVGKEQSMTASSTFEGTAKSTLADLSMSVGVSVTSAVSFTTEYSYTVESSKKAGKYRMVLVWPGASVNGVVTAEPNGDGNNQVMDEDGSTKLKPKKRVLTDETITYAPKMNKAYVDLEYSSK
ncbi:MAG: hypothetical protein E7262_05960 [Lachnospiraceae bacterium]|nr:hypothetical protein [Lachnospiraceae bacterium]